MRRMSTLVRVLTCALPLVACAETSQERVQLPLEVIGTASATPRMA